MNFGPLNRGGGERRLNVAITRARRELRIFAALQADQVDLARTQSIGVRDFKHFLEFAERGPRALAEATHVGAGDFESPFEQAVASRLAEHGWQIHPQVGASSFRIDLAVVHPDKPGRYLAAVECDGASYHRAASARDRDKLREAVLRGLGWEILRVWSTDWWMNESGALEKLHLRLQRLLEAERKARKSTVQAQTEAAAEPAKDQIDRTDAVDTIVGSVDSTLHCEPQPEEAEPVPAQYASAAGVAIISSSSPETTRTSPSAVATYRKCDFSTFEPLIDPPRFYDSGYTPVLKQLVETLIEAEGPIRDECLVRRIARLHGFDRAGNRIRKRVLGIAKCAGQTTKEEVGLFYWPPTMNGAPTRFRAPAGDAGRDVDDIPIEELRALAQQVWAQGFAGDDALREMASRCGIKRVTSGIRKRLQSAATG